VQQWPHWRVEVRDDGKGFAGLPHDDAPHVGLDIMRERAGRIGGTVAVDSAPGAGTRVVLTLPPPALRVAA
jgi:two-component system nitrate/nitrite sensor histidine kinase NarX